ncbi:radical SAM family heme chaperone HemW [Glycocaulis sp.]
MNPVPLGLYIHWPYCARICPYCDFNVYKAGRNETGPLYEALLADLALWRDLTGPRPLASIHFGGGTPSLMAPQHIEGLIGAAEQLFGLEPDAEIGLEANPAELAHFGDIARAGVGRLSIGMQALDDGALKRLGRDHDAALALNAFDTARDLFARVSADLIYAREGQGPADWKAELSAMLSRAPDHLSLYQLTIEPGTAFDRQMARGTLRPPGEEDAAEMFETTQELTQAAGLEAYEISNHARGEAHRSRHNRLYWTGGDWIGIGPGAHGRLGSHVTGGRRASAAPLRPADYGEAVKAGRLAWAEPLGALEEAQERILMGLRISEGLDRTTLKAATGHDIDEDAARQHAGAGFITLDEARVALTASGRIYADRIAMDLAPSADA